MYRETWVFETLLSYLTKELKALHIMVKLWVFGSGHMGYDKSGSKLARLIPMDKHNVIYLRETCGI